MDARELESAFTELTVAVMPVHLGGNVADLETILASAQRHNLPVTEDARQSRLAEWKGRRVGTLGKVGCFSFQASRNLNSGKAILLSQITRLADPARKECRVHDVNAEGNTRYYARENVFRMHAQRLSPCICSDTTHFGGLSREQFLKALRAEGIPASGGYSPLNTEPLIRNTLSSRGFRRIFSEKLARA